MNTHNDEQQPDLFGGNVQQEHHEHQKQPVRKNRSTRPIGHYTLVIEKFLLSRQSDVTRLSYASDLRDFFGGQPTTSELYAFLNLEPEELKQRMEEYRKHLRSRQLSEATINRRLTGLRSFYKYAYQSGLSRTDGHKIISQETHAAASPAPYKLDPEVLQHLIAAPGTTTTRQKRDTAILHLLCGCALHRLQLCELNVGDFRVGDRQARGVWVNAKEPEDQSLQDDQSPQVRVPLSTDIMMAVSDYLKAAGHGDQKQQPLFRNLDPRRDVKGKRLTVDGIYHLIRYYGKQIGFTGKPGALPVLNSRQLRHAAIAAALRAASGSAKQAHGSLPHISLDTLERHSRHLWTPTLTHPYFLAADF